MHEHLCDPRFCPDHPHCHECGGVMIDKGDRVVCVGCGIDAEVGAPTPATPEPVPS